MNSQPLARFVEWSRTRQATAVLALIAVAAVYLVTNHWAHTLQVLPYALVLLCPLLHLLMHAGHGNHAGRSTSDEPGANGGHTGH